MLISATFPVISNQLVAFSLPYTDIQNNGAKVNITSTHCGPIFLIVRVNQRLFSVTLIFRADLHGTTLSHATSLRQAYDINCFV